MKKVLHIFIIALLLPFAVMAQKKAQLHLIGAAIGDSVVLRWAVGNSDAWKQAGIAGYLLERTVLDQQNKVIGKSLQRVTNDTIRPWTYSSLERKINRKDTFALLAAQCLYGKSMRTKTTADDLIGALKEADSEESNRHGFALVAADMSAEAANLLGWRWVDKDIKKGYKYIYLLHCPKMAGNTISDTAVYILNPGEYLPLTGPAAPVLAGSEGHITITWAKESPFSAYYPERSEDGIHFKRLTNKPYMEWVPRERPNRDSMSYVDSVGINYKPFYYRLTGINPFAQVSPPSESIKGMAIDQTPPLPPEDLKLENTIEGQVKTRWKNPVAREPLMGIVIGKTTDPAAQISRVNENILPPDTDEFTDTHAWQFGTNFYTVGIMDTAGNIGWSSLLYVVMQDDAPPLQPFGLKGSIDTSGLVKLTWNLGSDNDLKGYNIYAANQADHVFAPIADTLITDTTFQYRIDLHNLTEHIYFKIKAFDKNLKSSEASAMLELKKPDIIAPDAPVFDDYKVSENRVHLHWRPSSAKDVTSQLLLRRTKDHPWEIYIKLPINTVSFDDTLLTAGQYWEYAIQAEDDAGLRSEPSFPVAVKIPASTKKKAVGDFTAVWDAEKNRVQLQWKVNADHVMLYRALNDGGLEMFARVAGNTITYFDSPQRKGKYTYAIKPFYADGSEGIISETVEVTTH